METTELSSENRLNSLKHLFLRSCYIYIYTQVFKPQEWTIMDSLEDSIFNAKNQPRLSNIELVIA